MTKDNLKNRLEELFTQSAQEERPERPEESAPSLPEAAPPGIAVSASGDTALAAGVDYHLILDSIQLPVVALASDMTILYCSAAYAGFAGRPVAELVGQNLLALFPEFRHTRLYAACVEVLETGGMVEAEDQLGKELRARVYRTPWGVLFVAEDAASSRLTVAARFAESLPTDVAERKPPPSLSGGKRAEEEREQLLADLARRALQLQTAAEVSRAASSLLSLDDLLPQTVELIRERFDLYYVGIFLVDEAERYIVLRAGSGPAGRRMLERGYQLAIGDSSMIAWCVANRQARIALDVGEEAVRFDNPWLPETRSELDLPLHSRGQVLGAMTVQSVREAAFSETDVTALQTMADQVANAIANARLFEQTQRRVAELATINAINQALTSHLELRAMLSLVVEKIHHIFDVPSAYIALYDRQTNLVEIPCLAEGDQSSSMGPFPLGAGFTSAVIRRRQPLLINHDIEQRRAELGAEVAGGKPAKSYLGVPIVVGHDVIGVIGIQDTECEGAFGEAEEHLLSTIAPSVGIAIQNARLFEQTQQRVADLTIVQRTMSALAVTLTREETIGALLPNVASAVQADVVSMFLLEREKMVRVGRYPTGDDSDAGIGQAIPLADYPLTRQVIETRRPLAFLADDPRLQEHARQSFAAAGITASATIPLLGQEGVLGSLAVSLCQPGRAFTEHDLSLLQTLADQASIAFEKVRLLEETYRLAQRTQWINQIAGKMREAVSVDEVLRIAVDELRQATHTSRAVARLDMPARANGNSQPPPRIRASGGQQTRGA